MNACADDLIHDPNTKYSVNKNTNSMCCERAAVYKSGCCVYSIQLQCLGQQQQKMNPECEDPSPQGARITFHLACSAFHVCLTVACPGLAHDNVISIMQRRSYIPDVLNGSQTTEVAECEGNWKA